MDISVLFALASLLAAIFRLGYEVGKDVGRRRK